MPESHARDSAELRPGREVGLHHRALRHSGVLKKPSAEMGIEDDRPGRERGSASETHKRKAVVDDLRCLGPLQLAVEALGRKADIIG